MDKVICEICGTVFPDDAEKCPLCGCSRDFGLDALEEELLLDAAGISMAEVGGQRSRKHKEMFDFPRRRNETFYFPRYVTFLCTS